MKIVRCVIACAWVAAFGAFIYSLPGWGQPAPRIQLGYTPWKHLSVPNNLPEGAIVVRETIPVDWMSLCGQPACEINGVELYAYGDFDFPVAGPDIAALNPGLKMQIWFDGKPVTTSSINVKPSRVEMVVIRTAGTVNTRPLAYLTTKGMTNFNVVGGSKFIIGASQDPITLVSGTCKVPDKTVELPLSPVYQFRGVGTTTDVAVPFELQITSCPPGYNQVGYTLSAAGAAPSSANGVLPPGPGATASGVAIQLTDPSGTPVHLNQRVQAAAYDKTTGGAFAIPLVARYMQTAAQITPGSVTGAIEVLMDYR
ncbi:fimbrial protein [Burkholderia sp. AW33-5]